MDQMADSDAEPTALATLDMGDIGSESARNQEIAETLFPDDGSDEPAAPAVAAEPDAPARTATPVAAPAPPSASGPDPIESDVPGFTKDARGRYHRPDGTQASKEEIETARAAAPPGTAPAAAAAATEPAAAVDAAPAGPEAEPLQWLAYGQPVEIPGAQYKPGHGYFIPEAAGAELRQAWARGHVRYPQVIAENEKLRAAVTSTFTQKEAEANAVIEIFGQYLTTPENFRQFLQDAAQSPDLALRELKAGIKERQAELSKNVTVPDAALMQNAPDAGEVAEALTDEIEDMFRSTELRGKFTPAAQRALTNRVFQRSAAYLTRADRDYPQDGVTKGDLVVNRTALWADMQYEASRTGSAAPKPSAPARAAPAAAAPGAQAASTAPPAPPSAVGRSRSVATPSPAGTPRSKATIPTRSLSETADWLMADD